MGVGEGGGCSWPVGVWSESLSAKGLVTKYTEDAGLPYFDRAAVIANGNWYYASALESMGAKLCFRYCLVNIGPSYK